VGLAPETHELLRRYDWPGNVRELANAVERAVLLSDGEVIPPESLPEEIRDAAPPGVPPARFHDAVREAKRKVVIAALEEAGASVTGAARLLGLHPNYLHRLLRSLSLRDDGRA